MSNMIFLRLFDRYFRHRWLYLMPILILSIAAGVYLLTFERFYISSGVIYTEQSTMLASLTAVQDDGFSWNTPAQDISNQFSDLFSTDAFLRAVIQETDLEAEMSKGDKAANETIKEVRKRMWVTITGNRQVQVSAANQDPRIAYQLAQAAISTFIQWKINLDRIDSETASAFFVQLIQEYRSDVEEARQALRSYLETHPEPVRGDRPALETMDIEHLQAELQFAGTVLARALEKAENARLAEIQVESNIRQKYTLLDAPDLPDKPAVSRRQMAMNAGIFLAVGVILSSIAVVGTTVLERSFRFPQDVTRELALPVLATVPDAAAHKPGERLRKRKTKMLESNEKSESLAVEASEESIPVGVKGIEVVIIPEQHVEPKNKDSLQ